MPVFSYRALNKSGKTIKGVIDADTPQKARQRLRAEGLHPFDLQPSAKAQAGEDRLTRFKKIFTYRRRGLGSLSDLTRQLSTLLAAGIPLVSALATIQEQTEDPNFRHILALVREQVTGGDTLASALGRHREVFPQEYIHLVRAGELGGALDQVLEGLADNLERRLVRRARLSSALAYPAFMTLVGGGVLFFLLSFIVPTLTGLFTRLGAALPWPTKLLLALSAFFGAYWWAVLIVAAAAVILITRLLKNETRYRRFEKLIFRLPLAGPLTQKLLLANAMRSLAVMTGGGVPLTTALSVAITGMGRSNFAAALSTASDMVSQGRSLADGLEASRLFPPVARRMVAVGEASGTLTHMLDRVAKSYEEETDRLLSTLTSLVEPIIIVVVGFIVGFVVLAVLLPIFDLSSLVG